LLGQIRLDIPYLVRAAIVVPLFALAWFKMPELGYTPRALELRRVPEELQRVFVEGLRYGLSHPVVRPVMLASLVSMSFMIFGFYSWQRYFLDLLGRDLVWVDGVISSLVGLSLIAGNVLVAPLSRVVRTRTGLLMVSVGAQVVLIGHRARDAREAGVPQRPHPVGAAGDDHFARLDVREHGRGDRAVGVGRGRAGALDWAGMGRERAHASTRDSTVLDSTTA